MYYLFVYMHYCMSLRRPQGSILAREPCPDATICISPCPPFKGHKSTCSIAVMGYTNKHTHTQTPQGSDYCHSTSRPFINVQSLNSRALTQPPAHLYSYQKHTHTHIHTACSNTQILAPFLQLFPHF